jgi:hypothetical protein
MRHPWLLMVCFLALFGAPALGCKRDNDRRSAKEHTSGEGIMSRSKKTPARPPTYPNPSQEALDRKARSTAKLASMGIAVAATLPVIADEKAAKWRTKDAVVERAIALMLV